MHGRNYLFARDSAVPQHVTHPERGDGSDGVRPAVLDQSSGNHLQRLRHRLVRPLVHARDALCLFIQMLRKERRHFPFNDAVLPRETRTVSSEDAR